MKRNRGWYKLSRILLTLLIMPPLGLFLLWRSSWSPRLKVNLTATTALLLVVVGAVVWLTGYYQVFLPPPVPASGFDTTRVPGGRYRIDRVLPFEREIFTEVVREMRQLDKDHQSWYAQTDANMMEDPQRRAITNVAERHNLDYEDAEGIFMKVSAKLRPRR